MANMNKLSGAMDSPSGAATRDSEKELGRMPPGGHPTVRVGGMGNSLGAGDAIKHLRRQGTEAGPYKVGKHKIG